MGYLLGEAAEALYRQARDLYRRISNPLGEANAARGLGAVLSQSDRARGQTVLEEALELYRRIPDPVLVATTQILLAVAVTDSEERIRHILEAREIFEQLGKTDQFWTLVRPLGLTPEAEEPRSMRKKARNKKTRKRRGRR